MRSSKSRSRSKTNRPRTLGNIINRVFDSSGPEGKVRGTPQQIIEKYLFLARDAQLSNDRVAAENFMQHAEHYTRLLAEANRELAAEQEARGAMGGNSNGQYGNGSNGQNGGQQNGNQQGGGQQNGGNRDRQGDNRDYRGDQPRQDNRGDHQRGEARSENRSDRNSDSRGEGRAEQRNDYRADQRVERQSDQPADMPAQGRKDTRVDYLDDQPAAEAPLGLMAGLNDLADAETGLVDTPEASPRHNRNQPRNRAHQPDASRDVPVASGGDAAAEAAPKKTRAPRKPKPADSAAPTDGDDQAAAE